MSITITIAVDNVDQLRAQLVSLCQLNGVDFDEAASNQRAATPKAEKPAGKPKPEAASAKKEEAAPETASEPADASPSDDAAPSLDDVKAAAQKYAGDNGRDALAELIDEFGGKNLSTIPNDKRAAFIAKCEEKTQ